MGAEQLAEVAAPGQGGQEPAGSAAAARSDLVVLVTRWAYLLLGLMVLVYLSSVLIRPHGKVLPLLDDWLTLTIQFGSAALCLVQAVRRGPGRLIGVVLGTGLLLWSTGDLLFDLMEQAGEVPVPSVADLFYLSFYPLTYVAVALVIRSARDGLLLGAWLDGLLTGTGTAAVCTALGLDVIFAPEGGSRLAAAVNLAYPIGDLVLVVVGVGALVMAPGSIGRWWPLLAGGALFVVSDTTFMVQAANGTYHDGALVDCGWPAAIVLMSAVGRPVRVRTGDGVERRRAAATGGRMRFLAPGVAALCGLTVLVYGTVHQLQLVDIVLAVTALVAAGARVLLMFQEVGALEIERRLREQAEDGQRVLAEREAENRALATRLSGLLNAAPVGIIETDIRGLVVRWNHAATSIYGWHSAEILGRPNPNAGPGSLSRAAAGAGTHAGDGAAPGTAAAAAPLRHVRRDGRAVTVEVACTPLADDRGCPTGLLTLVTDVSRRQELEIQLRHAQRLESVGRLAEGLAHEINTPIQFVGDNLRFVRQVVDALVQVHGAQARLRQSVTAGRPVAESMELLDRLQQELDVDFLVEESSEALEGAVEGIERVAAIVQAMKVFGRPGDGGPVPVDLNEAVRTVLVVARHRIEPVADVVTEFGGVPTVLCRPDDINQALLDLVANAVDAIAAADRGRGELRIRTAVDGSHVLVEVSDTGTGIPPAVGERIFDPFFTTKPVGQGIGQGLAAARTIVVDRHQGSICFRTEIGVGSTFTVRLPGGDRPDVPGRSPAGHTSRGGQSTS